jgi:anoctamin-10/anoctamin-7
LFRYDVLMGTFKDYGEMVIQFGYCTLFVAAFPLAPALAFVNNAIEIRVDGWKLCQVHRRPYAVGAEDIGTWYTFLEIMSTIAVISNMALFVFTGSQVKAKGQTKPLAVRTRRNKNTTHAHVRGEAP